MRSRMTLHNHAETVLSRLVDGAPVPGASTGISAWKTEVLCRRFTPADTRTEDIDTAWRSYRSLLSKEEERTG